MAGSISRAAKVAGSWWLLQDLQVEVQKSPIASDDDLCFRMMRQGFTLAELVIVSLILGVLAAVVVPKVIKNTGKAEDAGLLRNLAVVREAIEMYAASNGRAYPGADGSEAKFKKDLAPYIRGRFPMNPIKQSNRVDVETSGDPLGYQPGPFGWRYDNQTGEFIANTNEMSRSDKDIRYWQH